MPHPVPVGPVVQAGASAGTTIAVPNPYLAPGAVARQEGDYIVTLIRAQGTVATDITPASGFARAGAANGAADRAQGGFIHKAVAGDEAVASWTFGGWSAGRSVAESQVWRNVDPVSPIAGSTPYTVTNPAAYSTTAPPFTAIAMWGDERTDTRSMVPASAPAGYTTLANVQNTLDSSITGSRTALWAGYLSVPEGGAADVAAASLTWAVGQSANRAIAFALRGITTPTPPTPTLPFADVAEFLSTPGATSAWRLGGGPYPQHSEYAADKSVEIGYKALEFSCGWTSDLVPFGLGPQYLDSIAGVTGNVDPTTMTWATLSSTYQIRNNPVSPGVYQPFYRLDDFLTKYAATNICIVDPKFGFDTIAKIDAMLDICDAHGGKDRILIKFDTPTPATNLSVRARARQYKVINYWGTDTAAMTAQQANWDALGVLYSADPSVFTTANSFGKPVWAAVIPNQAGYDAAMANGADFANISGVTLVAPVGAPEADPQPWANAYVGTDLANGVYVGLEQVWP